MLESRRETSQPFKGGRQPIRIPIRRRGNCRDYSMFLTNSCTRFKQSPSIERRSDPTEDPSIPSLKPESSDTLQDRGDPRRQQERRRGQRRLFCHSDVRTSNVTRGPRNYWPFNVSIDESTSKRDIGWSMKRSIRLDSNGLRDHDEAHVPVPLPSLCSLYACLFNRRYPLSSNYTIDPARSGRDVSSCYIFRLLFPFHPSR